MRQKLKKRRGNKIPSVTQVLKPFTNYENLPQDVVALAGKRGTRVHAAGASIALGVPILRRSPEDEGYIPSFANWFIRYVVRVVAVEKKLIDPNLNFYGHPDFILELIPGMIPELANGDLTVLDLKTPITHQKAWRPQNAAYLHLARINGFPAKVAAALQLDPDGGPAKMNWYRNDARDFAAFINALNCWNYFNGG